MLSSTFTDLVEHRLKAKRAIEKLGFHAIGMESGGAQVADVITASLTYVRDSAAYIGIITKRYGQTPVDADRNPDERSITELEFDEAVRLDRPILLFIMADHHKVLEDDIELDPVRREKLAAFKTRAKRMRSDSEVERVWEPFDSLEDFTEKVGHAIGKLAIELALEDYKARSGGLAIPEPAVRRAIGRFIEVRREAAEAEIVAAVETFETGYRALQDQVAAIETADNCINSLRAGAEQALDEGDLDTARRLYGEAATAAREKLTEPARATARLYQAEASAHLLALDWEAADTAWATATTTLVPFDLAAGESIAWEAGLALAEHGLRFGRGGALRAAIDRWRSLAEAADGRGDSVRAASLRSNLGSDLSTLGERTGGEDGLALLADAVVAFRAALTVRTETAMPAQWASTQNNLGNVLLAQSQSTGGETGLALLGEAAAAVRAALTVHTQTSMPTEWAMSQNNLGIVLKSQGERTGGEAGLALLAEAVAAYRAALTVRTETSTPAEWARIQNNLGNALLAQGRRTDGEKGLALLAEAVVAYSAALTVLTEAAMPADWAMTQNNLGNVLLTQGRRTGGDAGLTLLADAVVAYRAALTVRTETGMPAKWAMTQENLAISHEAMADLGDAPRENLEAAVVALSGALSIYTPEHTSFYYEQVTLALARVREKLAALET